MKSSVKYLLSALIALLLLSCSREVKPEPVVNYLTFASAEPFTIGVRNAQKNWDGTLYYSTDTANWSEWSLC